MCQLSNKFFSAVRTLSGDGPIKRRLAKAYADNLELVREDEIPEIIRPKFVILRQAMHSAKPANRKESPVLASVRKMSNIEANRYSKAIVAMFSELVRVKATGERLISGKRATRKRSPKPSNHGEARLN